MGRPTKYEPGMNDIAEAYIEEYQSTHEHKIPSIAGLSLVLKIRRSTLYEWMKFEPDEENPGEYDDDRLEFSDILEDIMAKQEVQLTSNGLSGAFNPTITKMMMYKHGYHEKQEVLGEGGGVLAVKVVYE